MTGAEWIWYNGDFELYHSIKMHNRREEFQTFLQFFQLCFL